MCATVVDYHNACGELKIKHMIAVQYSGTLSWYALLMLSTVVSSREKNQNH